MSHDNHPAAGSSASQQNPPPNTWTEPPWSGWIETTGDALLILEAARRGLIPRVTRRLVDSERKMITSGSVFVFDEDESGIKRWTDGFFWSPSRILGNFLLYRETEKRGAGHRSARMEREPVNEQYDAGGGVKSESGQSLSRPKSETTRLGIDRQRERSLVGSLTNSYKFKPGGMMKKVRTPNLTAWSHWQLSLCRHNSLLSCTRMVTYSLSIQARMLLQWKIDADCFTFFQNQNLCTKCELSNCAYLVCVDKMVRLSVTRFGCWISFLTFFGMHNPY